MSPTFVPSIWPNTLILITQIAGIAGKPFEYPFDTVKVRLQSQPENLPLRYSGPIDCFKQSLRSGGFNSLYRGVSAPLFGAAVETSSLFFSYRLTQKAVSDTLGYNKEEPLPLSALVACGAISGGFTSVLLTPIELVKCQIQAEPGKLLGQPKNPLSVIACVYRHHGVVGFWRGQFGTLIRETGGSAAWFGSYEGVTAFFRKQHSQHHSLPLDEKLHPLPIWQQLLAGATTSSSTQQTPSSLECRPRRWCPRYVAKNLRSWTSAEPCGGSKA